MRIERRWWLTMLPLVAAGCGFAFQAPTLRVAEVRLSAIHFGGGTLLVTVDVENPNRYSLRSEDFSYRLAFLDDEGGRETWLTLAEGGLAEPLDVPGGETGSVDVEVPFDFGDVGSAVGRLLRRGELEYRFTGALTVRTPVGSARVPFDERGLFRP